MTRKRRGKYTHEEVEKIFSENGCELLSQYENTASRLKYVCVCGNTGSTEISKFIKGQRCKECQRKNNMYSFEEVKSIFDKRKYDLISKEYKGIFKKLKFICPEGHAGEITFKEFKNGHGCILCGHKIQADKRRRNYSDVKKLFEDNGCVLLTEHYIDSRQKLEYICVCGKLSETYMSNFIRGHRCFECGSKERGENRRKYDYEFVKKYFEVNGYRLVSKEYKVTNEKLKFMCPNGHSGEIIFASFLRGSRCVECRFQGTSHLAEYLRRQIDEWKIESLKEYAYKCAISHETRDIQIHHLYSFNKIVNEFVEKHSIEVYDEIGEYKRDELNRIVKLFPPFHDSYGLGVPLRKDIHKKFHAHFGNDNTPEQFEEFKELFHNLC